MRVLVVEDQKRMATLLKRGLEEEGYAVDLVGDGNEAVWLGTEHDYDVIVLDIMLPRLNGYDVLKGLRLRQVWTPVLMLTAKDGEFDQTDAFDLGADDYLIKPFSFAVLVARLRALQRRGAPTRPTVLTSGDTTLDPARRRVHHVGEEVEMTRREYSLLEFLLRHQGMVVSKAEILAGVWDAHYDGDDNIVEVYVGYLRRKLGAQVIETIRGSGYRLRTDD